MKTMINTVLAVLALVITVLLIPHLVGSGDSHLALADVVLLGGGDLVKRGITNLKRLRPVLAANADPFAVNATLRHEEWERLDERVNRVMRDRLTVVDDLRSRGLIETISIGSIIRRTERLEDFDDAELSFDGETSPKGDRPSFLADTVPVPVISKDFRLNWRQLAASRERGESLDTTAGETAARKVRDKMQALVTNGLSAGGPMGGGIPGFTSATNRITVTLNNNWDDSNGDPVGDVERMLAAAYAKYLFGPFVVYVPNNYWATVQEDYSTGSGSGASSSRTIMQRILEFADVEAVRPLDALSDDNVVMVQMTREVIDYSEAQAVTTVQWERNPFVTQFRVLTVGGPHIKSIETQDGDTINGIIHLS